MAMAINVILIIVCLFLIAQYLEGTLHKGSQLGCRQKGFKEFQRDMIKAMKHFDIHIYNIYVVSQRLSKRMCIFTQFSYVATDVHDMVDFGDDSAIKYPNIMKANIVLLAAGPAFCVALLIVCSLSLCNGCIGGTVSSLPLSCVPKISCETHFFLIIHFHFLERSVPRTRVVPV